MRKIILNIILFSLIGVFAFTEAASAYWVWTPGSKKFVNPKYAVKDSPKEQFDWAMSFYDAKDYQRAATEFEKLAKQYEFSEYASKAQYYVGLSYENMQKYYIAFENYQKALDNFPHISNMEEIIARQYAIGNVYLSKPGPKVLGTDIMAPLDRAVEIFKKVVENAPYGKYAEDAQFKLGEALKKSERYEEAVQAYHKLVDDYPNSKLATQAMYEESYCAYKASLKPAYDVAATDNAIKTFQKFVYKNKDAGLAKEADKTMKRLKDNVAEKSFKAAEFYESQGKTKAAIIYYQDVVDTYPDSSLVGPAKAKIEQLKNKNNKKVEKPEAKKVTEAAPKEASEKKPWKPFSFDTKKPEKVTKAPETPVAEAPKVEPVTQAVEAPKVEPAAQTAEAPRAAESPAPAPAPEPKAQTTETAKKEEVAHPPKVASDTQIAEAQSPPEKKAWKPLSFGAKKKEVAKEASEKKPWSPFKFESKKEPVVKETPRKKKEWKPWSFDTKEPKKVTKTPEAPKVEPVTQAVEAPKVEPATQAVEAPRAAESPAPAPAPAPEAQTTETAKKEEVAPQTEEAPKQKTWKPWSFDTKKKDSVKKVAKKKEWKPLNFGTSDEPMVKDSLIKREREPLDSDKK